MGIPGGPTAFHQALDTDLGRLMFQVTPDNVIQVHHILAAEATMILHEVRLAGRTAAVGVAAKDPVSEPAAHGFNAKIQPLLDQGFAYGNALQTTADQLKATITSYGHTEEEITSSFGQFSTDYQAQHAQPEATPSALAQALHDVTHPAPSEPRPARSLGDLLVPPNAGQSR